MAEYYLNAGGSPEERAARENSYRDYDSKTKSGDAEVAQAIAQEDFDQLEKFVLNGEGDRLLRLRAADEDVQDFIDNVPMQMVSRQQEWKKLKKNLLNTFLKGQCLIKAVNYSTRNYLMKYVN